MDEFALEQQRIDNVREKIRLKIGSNIDFLSGRKKDIVEFRRYAWEELSHLEQPEPFERLEFERQENEYVRKSSEQRRLSILYPSPYFARVDFRENGETEPEPIYIGKFSFFDDETLDLLVCDWRAPISSMFYDFEYGKAFYESPDGMITGDITLKRQYSIEAGVLKQMFESALEIQDSVLQEILSHHVDDRMRTIVTTIQREQNKAIRDEKYGVLVISGPAGSGKTSIALHRIAYLLYHHRRELSEDNFLIFSPNDIFSDYISDVLPSLGEKSVAETTFLDFARNLLSAGLESREEYLEDVMTGSIPDSRRETIVRKGSQEFTKKIETAIAEMSARGPKFHEISYRGEAVMAVGEMTELFLSQSSLLTVNERLVRVRAAFFEKLKLVKKNRVAELHDELIERNGRSSYLNDREIRREARSLWYRDFLVLEAEYNQKNMPDCFKTYGLLLRKQFGEPEADAFFRSVTADRVRYEDTAPLLYLRLLLGLFRPDNKIRQAVIDEAQDYSFLQYRLLSRLFPRAGFTILGDASQTLTPAEHRDDLSYIAGAFHNRSVGTIALGTSYRSTKEIGEFAAGLLGNGNPNFVDRHGEPPEIVHFTEEAQKIAYIKEFLFQKGEGSTSAVITKTKADATRLHALVGGNAKLISGISTRFSKGALVIPSYLSKGLEFDHVIVDASGNDFDKNLLYTCCTRALHQLAVIR